MSRIVLTVIGDDRAGLVAALSEVVKNHAGNWERSQLAQLEGKFAGIVVVSVPEESVAALTEALRALGGQLEVTAHTAADGAAAAGEVVRIDLLGNDRPGIVQEVSGVLHHHNLSIDEMETLTSDAPMAGLPLFEAHIAARVPADVDLVAVRADLERLATELMVDINLSMP